MIYIQILTVEEIFFLQASPGIEYYILSHDNNIIWFIICNASVETFSE